MNLTTPYMSSIKQLACEKFVERHIKQPHRKVVGEIMGKITSKPFGKKIILHNACIFTTSGMFSWRFSKVFPVTFLTEQSWTVILVKCTLTDSRFFFDRAE